MMTRLMSIFVAAMFLFAPAMAAGKAEFTFDGKVFRSIKYPESYVAVGERLSLLELGRRFPGYEVSAVYFSEGDSGYDAIRSVIEAYSGASFSMTVEDETIVSAGTDERGVAGEEGAQVGDEFSVALGDTAYCDFTGKFASPFCASSDWSSLAYSYAWDDECKPRNFRGQMEVPGCIIDYLYYWNSEEYRRYRDRP